MHESSGSLDALAFLAAAVICVPIARRFGLGAVLGYLVGGAIIGPFGLGLVRNDESIHELSELGVVLMLFIIGLELDPKRLWGMRRSVFGGGALQFVACAIPLVMGAILVGLPWKAAIVVGLALALSSTAIAMQVMGEKNFLPTPAGQTSFAILLFQDIAAIPLLAIVPLLGVGSGSSEGDHGWRAIAVIGAIGAVILAGRFLLRPLLNAIARVELREIFTAFALFLVLGIATLMESVGVSMALGAFLAGVLLASSEYRHALESDLEPFRGLLMGLFFLSVGMSIDFGLLASKPLLVALLVSGFTVAKLFALRLIATPLNVTSRQRWHFALLLAQGGEFAFVVFGVAKQVQLLPGEWDGLLTLMVALSMMLTPLMLVVHDKLEARRVTEEREPDAMEDAHVPVIIAGFGRFGQIVGRLLLASGLRPTVLDHDPDQIEFLRKFGFRIFYGDATRADLLHAAGAHHAKILVNAIDDVEESLALVDVVKHEFPNLELVCRARNVSHYFELRKRGVTIVEREVFDSALVTGRKVLEGLGVGPHEAFERATRFRRHNIAMLEAIREHEGDESRTISMAAEAREQLERQFQRESEALDRQAALHWHHDEDRQPS